MSTNTQFKGLWAIILGGSSGFGLATAEKLAAHGMNIAVLYRETAITERPLLKQLSKIAEENNITILPHNLNALTAEARDKFIKETPIPKHGVKLMLHSIARGNLKPLTGDNTLTTEDIQFTSYAMSNSMLDWARDVLTAGLFHADARVIGLTSEGAHKYWDGYAAVSIAKSSLESLAKYMAVEFAPFGLKTNIIQAGITETSSLKMIPGSEKLIGIGNSRNPLGRITQTADVAKVVYLLCTDDAFWINGALIHVDGGEHCR
ncbi:MAG: SDR family oxidoreductase [Bacteroidetes bacterium]|nr:SDR family oxidoreductase [Bacteroidota bacterium]